MSKIVLRTPSRKTLSTYKLMSPTPDLVVFFRQIKADLSICIGYLAGNIIYLITLYW